MASSLDISAFPEKRHEFARRPAIIAITIFFCILIILAIFVVIHYPQYRLHKCLSLGEKYLDNMEYREVILEFRKALDIDDKNEEIYVGLINAYIGLEKYDKTKETALSGISVIGETKELQDLIVKLNLENSLKMSTELDSEEDVKEVIKENEGLEEDEGRESEQIDIEDSAEKTDMLTEYNRSWTGYYTEEYMLESLAVAGCNDGSYNVYYKLDASADDGVIDDAFGNSSEINGNVLIVEGQNKNGGRIRFAVDFSDTNNVNVRILENESGWFSSG